MNRAKEFLFEALDLMKYGKWAQAETVVQHALHEVYELEQLAGQAGPDVRVLDAQPAGRWKPAQLTAARKRNVLEG